MALIGTIIAPNDFAFKNRIINGDMRIDQRNAGASVTVNATTEFYAVDRFNAIGQAADGVFTVQRSTVAPTGFANSLLATVTTADASIGATQVYVLQQKIEGFNFSDFGFGTANASTVTLSFWVRSSVTGTFGGSLTNDAINRAYPFTYTINAANTFEYKTITIAGDTTGTWLTDNGIGLRVYFNLGVGSSYTATAGAWASVAAFNATGASNLIATNGATFYITGVQLEAGSVASPFERRDIGREMMMCQRYYWRYGGVQFGGAFMPMVLFTGIATNSLAATIQLPVRARTPPTSITLGGSAPAINSGTITNNLALDRNASDSVMVFILGTGFVALSSYRWIGNPDATTFLSFEGMEL